MKSIKLAADATLGVSLVLFSYIYWTIYRIENGDLNSRTPEEITIVTVHLFYWALSLAFFSLIFRAVVLKTQTHNKGLNWGLLIISTIPLLKWLFDMFAYSGS